MSPRSAADTHPDSDPLKPFRSRLKQALAASPLADGQLLTITLAAPQTHFSYFPRLEGNWFFWGRPSQDCCLLGSGEALRLTAAAGDGRLEWLARRLRQIRQQWLHLDPDQTGHPATAFTGFAFSGDDPMTGAWQAFPNAALILPELLLRQENGKCTLSFTARVQVAQAQEITVARWMARLQRLQKSLSAIAPSRKARGKVQRTSAVPSEAGWLQLVDQAVYQIRQGSLDKVVPARCIQVRAPRPVDPGRLMTRLAQLHPDSTLVSARIDDNHFVAATPERLAAVSDHRITCDAIGGTGQRLADAQQDRQLAEALRSAPKTRLEHALVVDGIREGLSVICSRLEPAIEPGLMRLRNLQHLWTPVRGTLNSETGLLDAAARLHPTAAVNGHPAAAASAWLSRHEATARGWYSGAAGWVAAGGDGELAVLLRCALVHGRDALLYAGAGVTGDSSPAAELAETELKLQTMLEALESA
jgi:menaquinone-specific isochorismate synthase